MKTPLEAVRQSVNAAQEETCVNTLSHHGETDTSKTDVVSMTEGDQGEGREEDD